jgi:predicted cobalt transporter CbtA
MKLLHKIIFWSHLLAGVIAGVVIFIMSATGVILMYEHQMVEYANGTCAKSRLRAPMRGA